MIRPHHRHPRLVIYPGERKRSDGAVVGTIYVVDGEGERYPMAGGPRERHWDRGHWAEPTPAGHYELDYAEHHKTRNWPGSVIPWGANMREVDGTVQYQVGPHWLNATGHHGTVYQSAKLQLARNGKSLPYEKIDAYIRLTFLYDMEGKVLSTYTRNDFGKWSWNLKQNGSRTAFYIHTTPPNETQAVQRVQVVLGNSHGCIHISPLDRDEMVAKAYLQKGRRVEVKRYGVKGPPS